MMTDTATRIAGYGENMTEMPYIGTPTFFRTDFAGGGRAAWREVDIGLVGVPTDAGLSHRPGSRYGPQAVRAQSGLIRYINTTTKVIPYDHARVLDLGDVPIDSTLNLDLMNEEIFAFFRQVRDAGVRPLSVGGDHSVTYPILRALGQDRPLALVHFDAHHDTAPPMKGTRLHHGAPFRNAVEDGLIDPRRSVQIGIRDPYQEAAAPFAYESGMTVIEMPEVEALGAAAVAARVREAIGDHPAYVSFDVDALDPAYAPGTGTPVVGGLTAREGMRILQGLAGMTIAGGDVVEVSPPFDPTGMTALVGAQMLFEILCIAALSPGGN